MKVIKRIFKLAFLFLIAIITIVILSVVIGKTVNYFKTKIITQNGIQESTYVNLGGIEQYIQIRGENKDNPLILFLHGGPGSPTAIYSYHWQTELEEDYTIVHWDQRGCGRTYYKNQNAPITTTEMMLSDLDELVTYLTDRFNQDKLTLIGHSWGTIYGTTYIQDHPEKVNAYIGIGQVVDSRASEGIAVEEAVRIATQQGDSDGVARIKNYYDTYSSNDFSLVNLSNLRNEMSNYFPKGDQASYIKQISMGLFSPSMNFDDFKWYLYPNFNLDGFTEINQELFSFSFTNDGYNLYKKNKVYSVPIYFISGNCDWSTPYTMVQDYYQTISAPKKEMIIIENSGHFPFLDNPDEFCSILTEVLQQQD